MAYKLAGLFDLSWPIFTLPSASPYLQPGHADHMSPLFFCDAGHMHKLILSTRRPCQCSDGGGLQELVAYGLFVAPFKPKLVYKNNIEASKIPPEWHLWIHHLIKNIPTENKKKFSWQKRHVENLTGSKEAYRPAGSLISKEKKNMRKYETWKS